MKEAFISKDFTAPTLRLIDVCNVIIDEYLADGYDLTLRQLYYQLVSRDIIPNRQREYNRLGRIVSDGRLAGMIDWDAITDRTRSLQGNSHWSSPEAIIRSSARGYMVDKWKNQPCRVEVWIEKDALTGVIEGVCTDLDVDFFSCRGYTSISEMYEAAQRHLVYEEEGQEVHVLHLSDHDPSGIDMTRDLEERLWLFKTRTVVQRIGLTMAQIRQYNPPPNPAKTSDSRFESYLKRYGRSSWELDALEPRVLVDLIRMHVRELRDDDIWIDALEEEDDGRYILAAISERMQDIRKFLNGEDNV